MKNAIRRFGLVGAALLGLVAAGSAWAPEAAADLGVTDPSLPPVSGEWASDPVAQMLDYGGLVQGYDVHLFDFSNIVRQNVGADERITCDALLTAIVTSWPGEPTVVFAGPIEILVFGKADQTTGTFSAQILSLDAAAFSMPDVLLRVSPNPDLTSTGQVTVTDLGGGLWDIDSFFDVYTDLSPDGGQNWLPDLEAVARPGHRLTLLPEPATLSLLVLGAACLLRRRR